MDHLVKIGPEVDREHLVEDLIKLNALVSGFFESVPGTFIVLDSRWHLIYARGEIEGIFTDNKISLRGKHLDEIIQKDYAHFLSSRAIEPLITTKEKTAVRYSNKLHKWFMISACESYPGIFIRLEDITKDQMMKRLLILNEFSVSRTVDMVFWIMKEGHIIYSNYSASEKLKYPREELARMKMWDIDLSLAGDKWQEFVNDLKSGNTRVYESCLRARDGSVIPVEVTCSYQQYSGQDYIFAFARDIRVRKHAERSILEAKAEAELYVDLMGHDINNMNQVAMGYLELALDMLRSEGRIDDAHAELIAKPYDMLQSSSQLIENVRKIQREKAGNYETSIMDVGSILREVKDSYARVPGRDIKIELINDGQCRVSANELLKDVFINLVGNSIKHSRGPLRINIGMKNIVDNGRGYCEVSVEDDGPGISDGMKKKLLNHLSPENSRAWGKGLGLYLIKQLVNDFHGRFGMEDRVPGDYTRGVKFIVLLPIAE